MSSHKKFTDIFICRPVLAIVVSLLLFILGVKSITSLQVRQFPKLDNTLITITTTYPGASAKLMEGFITTPIEKSVASAEGVDYMTSTSINSTSTINVYVRLNFDPNVAFTDVMSKVSQVQGQLPRQAEQPVLQKQTGSDTSLMYVAFDSNKMNPEQITDYIARAVQPKLESVAGVASAEILGGKTFAMRIWLNSRKMAALNVTPQEVSIALENNNFQTAAGSIKGNYISIDINAKTGLENTASFERLVIKNVKGSLVRLGDIAKVQLGSEDYDSSVYFNGRKAIFIGINATPTANPLSVINDVKQIFPEIKAVYPPSLNSKIVYDATKYIRTSIHEVIQTIFEATIIVILVIFLFLGSLRNVLIPMVTIPLSLIGMCFIMLLLGYSLNLLTLLAMVLAIGMVVDDAIVVVENIHRHIEAGLTPFKAAIKGAREIAAAIVVMSVTLAAVYAPIGFMSGVTGALFTQFAFSLAGAVIISGIIALTLSPMMCSKLLAPNNTESKLVNYIDKKSEQLKNRYFKTLHGVLNYRSIVLVVAATVLMSCFFLYVNTTSELAPSEDEGALIISATGPEYANLNYMRAYTSQFYPLFKSYPATEDSFVLNGRGQVNNAIGIMIMKPWNKRRETQNEAMAYFNPKIADITGLQSVAFPPPSLPGNDDGLPVQFILTSVQPFTSIYPVAQKIVEAASKSGLFFFIDNSLKYNRPQLVIDINRNKAADLGISMSDIGGLLSSSLGGNYVNWFSMYGHSYQVIPQLGQDYRLNPDDLNHIYLKTVKGELIPLSSVASIYLETVPNGLTHFQQLNSATIQGLMAPGHTISEGLAFLQAEAKKVMPSGMNFDYAGISRQYVEEGSALLTTFFLSLIIIYLVLAAQFESFRDPFIILISVPMSICGALIPLNLGLATINIYTQIGLITLIGLISKHGILMVEFANQLQAEEGLSVRDAIEKSASVRLRPILMTTAAMVLGVLPLIVATGAGAASRFDIGLVIASGMLIGTCFTLFVVPTMYTLLAKKHKALLNSDD